MLIVNSTDAKKNFGRILESTMREPIGVTKSGRRVAVILSAETYDRLSMLEDAYWSERALAAAAGGFIGPDEAMKALTRMNDEKAQPNI